MNTAINSAHSLPTKKFPKGQFFLQIKQDALVNAALLIDELNGHKLSLRDRFSNARNGSDEYRKIVKDALRLVKEATDLCNKAL